MSDSEEIIQLRKLAKFALELGLAWDARADQQERLLVEIRQAHRQAKALLELIAKEDPLRAQVLEAQQRQQTEADLRRLENPNDVEKGDIEW